MSYRQVETSVIIPTMASSRRADLLRRAIRSVTTDQATKAIPIVVANGDDFDPAVLDALEADRSIRFFYREEGDLPKAINFGRRKVETPYFGFLDDDDEYLPGALSARLRPMLADWSVDAVVANGYWIAGDRREEVIPDIDAVTADPVGALMESNWLSSCGGLYRTDSIGIDYFDPNIRYLEWTYLAFRLALEKRLVFVPEATFIVNDTPSSLSKSVEYEGAIPDVLKRILAMDMSARLRRKVRTKLSAALHNRSNYFLRRGEMGKAWRHHARSLNAPTALLRYGLFTCRLILAVLK